MNIVPVRTNDSYTYQIHDTELGHVFDLKFYSKFSEYCIVCENMTGTFQKINWHAGYKTRLKQSIGTDIWCGLIKTGHSLFDLALERCEKFLKFLKFELQLVPLLNPGHYQYPHLFFDPSTGTNLHVNWESTMVEVSQSDVDEMKQVVQSRYYEWRKT